MEVETKEVKKDKGPKGLKLMRAGWKGLSKPDYKCDNCGCMRYNECYCPRSKEKEKKDEPQEAAG